jgi:hypothetical protein
MKERLYIYVSRPPQIRGAELKKNKRERVASPFLNPKTHLQHNIPHTTYTMNWADFKQKLNHALSVFFMTCNGCMCSF